MSEHDNGCDCHDCTISNQDVEIDKLQAENETILAERDRLFEQCMRILEDRETQADKIKRLKKYMCYNRLCYVRNQDKSTECGIVLPKELEAKNEV